MDTETYRKIMIPSMPTTSLIRTVRFRAVHHYRRRDWTDARNREAFGAQVDPHAHQYRVSVAVSGAPSPETGFIIDLATFDRLLEDVLGPLRDHDLNDTIPEVRDGSMQPSTEALGRWLWRRLDPGLPDGVTLQTVEVWESDHLGARITASATLQGR